MKISIVSTSDIYGGAARAAFRLHNAFKYFDINSEMIVKNKLSDYSSIKNDARNMNRIKDMFLQQASKFIQNKQYSLNPILHSGNWFGSNLFEQANESDSDIINIHWVNGEGLSIKQIADISKPKVMTLHDMWAFCGGEHYCEDNNLARFRCGYTKNNAIYLKKGFDLDRKIWERKLKYWTQKFPIVTPSNWLSKCASESLVFSGWDIRTIPNVLDVNVYKPFDKILSRELLGLPVDKKLIGFGAMGGGRDPRKGADLLFNAIKVLSDSDESKYFECVIFGQSKPEGEASVSIPLNYLGHLNDDVALMLFYNAIDVMVVPSRLEAFGQTASEAQSCGTPVVAFNSTGLVDIIEHKTSGYLADAFDCADLADGILWCTSNEARQVELSINSRKRALSNWSVESIFPKYRDLFNDITK